MKKTAYTLITGALAVLSFTCCTRKQYEFVSFNGLEGADEEAFSVTSIKTTHLSEGIPQDCIIPEELQEETKTTSTTGPSLLSKVFEYCQGDVLEIAGTYSSVNLNTFDNITLSGKVLLPKGRKPKRYIVVSHYTIGSNAEAPSNCFPLEGVLCDMGYAMIFPDYQGYGVDSKNIHPYLVMEQTAYDVCMMYVAVSHYLKGTDYEPENPEIYLMGYSQGGATTMAVQYLIESLGEYIWESLYNTKFKIKHVFAGGGPYDARATYNEFITSNKVNIPCAVPLVIQGMSVGTDLDIDIEKLLQPWIYSKLDEWINSKNYSTAQLKHLMGTTTTSDILTPIGMDPTSDEVSELYKKLSENSIVAVDWAPQAPVYMLHSMDDDVVPFVNATKAKVKWADANIQYNFGHYGSHTRAALRFIYSVKTWLNEEN